MTTIETKLRKRRVISPRLSAEQHLSIKIGKTAYKIGLSTLVPSSILLKIEQTEVASAFAVTGIVSLCVVLTAIPTKTNTNQQTQQPTLSADNHLTTDSLTEYTMNPSPVQSTTPIKPIYTSSNVSVSAWWMLSQFVSKYGHHKAKASAVMKFSSSTDEWSDPLPVAKTELTDIFKEMKRYGLANPKGRYLYNSINDRGVAFLSRITWDTEEVLFLDNWEQVRSHTPPQDSSSVAEQDATGLHRRQNGTLSVDLDEKTTHSGGVVA